MFRGCITLSCLFVAMMNGSTDACVRVLQLTNYTVAPTSTSCALLIDAKFYAEGQTDRAR
jgi:hypothetical protein